MEMWVLESEAVYLGVEQFKYMPPHSDVGGSKGHTLLQKSHPFPSHCASMASLKSLKL
jgi:hypothetical protein